MNAMGDSPVPKYQIQSFLNTTFTKKIKTDLKAERNKIEAEYIYQMAECQPTKIKIYFTEDRLCFQYQAPEIWLSNLFTSLCQIQIRW